MAYLTWLADELRAAGLTVREVSGWKTRGHGAMHDAVLGVIAHHTAGGASGDFPSEKVVVEGRPGLAGPLCNLGLTRSGVWVVVAAGQAYHAGTGSMSWCPANQGNSRLIGVEAESVGTRDDWTPAQRASYPRGVAALLRRLNLPASRAIGHKEWAPTRKIDPAFWDMADFRADVARWITAPTTGAAVSTPSTRDQVWQAPVPDYVTAAPNDTVQTWQAVAWANAHAAAARAASEATYAVVTRMEKALTQPAAAPGPAVLTDADVKRIADAVAPAVLDLLAKRTAA